MDDVESDARFRRTAHRYGRIKSSPKLTVGENDLHHSRVAAVNALRFHFVVRRFRHEKGLPAPRESAKRSDHCVGVIDAGTQRNISGILIGARRTPIDAYADK